MIEKIELGFSRANEFTVGKKNHQERAAEIKVDTIPPFKPPTHELKKTAG